MAGMDKQQLIAYLQLEPHPHEGGYFRRTYEAQASVPMFAGQRKLMTSIFYLLTNDSPRAFLHRNRSDIVHYFHVGDPVEYLLIDPDGNIHKTIMGADLAAGQLLQLTVPGGYWKSSRLVSGEYGLISEAVAPGFDYADNELADEEFLESLAEPARKQIDDWLSGR